MRTPSTAARIAKLRAKGESLEQGEPVPDEVLDQLDDALGGRLPQSFRDCLSEFGWLERYGSFVSGVVDGSNFNDGGGTVLGDTETAREMYGLAQNLIVIELHEDGAYCLDLHEVRGGEPVVVNFEPHGQAKVAQSFGDWLARFFLYDPDD